MTEPWVNQARAGEGAAWEHLFRRYQLPLFTFAAELLRDEQAALDVVQETFVRAVRHLPSLREDGRFGSWLFSIAHQQCQAHWRRQRRVLISESLDESGTDLEDDALSPLESTIRQEDEAHFLAALAALPDGQRAVVLLHCLEDFPLEDIARITGVPVGTVKSRLHHARRKLRQQLEEEP